MMSLLRRSLAVVGSTAVMMLVTVGGYPLGAQEQGSGKSQTAKGKTARQAETPPATSTGKAKTGVRNAPPDAMHRVPYLFGRLGLSDQQREAIYKIEGRYVPRIQALEKEVDDLRSKMMGECEGVLTAPQKQMLEQNRKAASAARKKAASKEAGKTTP